MEGLIVTFLPLAIKYGPEIYQDIVAAFTKAGYTVQQVEAIFAQVKPYEALGINPNAPVQPENPAAPAATPAAPPVA